MSAPADRRSEILAAALASFLERGYRATSIADIRRLSGASTGSIYHFFEGKGALAMALLTEAVAGWSAAGAEAAREANRPEAAIKASVRGLVTWGLANPELFRFMDEIRTVADHEPEFLAVREALEAGQRAARSRFEQAAAEGLVRRLSWPVAHSLMLGPAYNYMRLVGRSGKASPEAPDLFANAAWEAVKA
jgi:AcrR family transcriptional regulator